MSLDLIASLDDDWWDSARESTNWEGRLSCLHDMFQILSVDWNTEITVDILHHNKSDECFELLLSWLVDETHDLTKIAILQLMPKLIESLPQKSLTKHVPAILENIMTKQWSGHLPRFRELATPMLLALWLKV